MGGREGGIDQSIEKGSFKLHVCGDKAYPHDSLLPLPPTASLCRTQERLIPLSYEWVPLDFPLTHHASHFHLDDTGSHTSRLTPPPHACIFAYCKQSAVEGLGMWLCMQDALYWCTCSNQTRHPWYAVAQQECCLHQLWFSAIFGRNGT